MFGKFTNRDVIRLVENAVSSVTPRTYEPLIEVKDAPATGLKCEVAWKLPLNHKSGKRITVPAAFIISLEFLEEIQHLGVLKSRIEEQVGSRISEHLELDHAVLRIVDWGYLM